MLCHWEPRKQVSTWNEPEIEHKILCQKGHTSKECIKMIINIYSVTLNLLTPKYSTHLSIPALITFLPKEE